MRSFSVVLGTFAAIVFARCPRRGEWRTGGRCTSVGQPGDELEEAGARVARPALAIVLERDHLPPKTFGIEDAREYSIGGRRRQPNRRMQKSGRGDGFEVQQIQLRVTP